LRHLSASDITRLCEWGADKHDLDRAIALLRLTVPDIAPEDLADWSIGRRDALLMRLRAMNFGSDFDMRVGCPKCDTGLEFGFSLEQLLQDEPPDRAFNVQVGELTLRYRLPSSRDLSAIMVVADATAARMALLGRCVAATGADGAPVHLSKVPMEAIEVVVARIAEDDPQADIVFKLSCVGCGHKWRTVFDILSYFWTELESFNTRVQGDVHTIASHYGWDEDTILRMTAERRSRYIHLIGA
jgi:hypothetical protein